MDVGRVGREHHEDREGAEEADKARREDGADGDWHALLPEDRGEGLVAGALDFPVGLILGGHSLDFGLGPLPAKNFGGHLEEGVCRLGFEVGLLGVAVAEREELLVR